MRSVLLAIAACLPSTHFVLAQSHSLTGQTLSSVTTSLEFATPILLDIGRLTGSRQTTETVVYKARVPQSQWGKRDASFHSQQSIRVSATTDLTENRRVYSVDNLMNTMDGYPWTTKGCAVGQTIGIGVPDPKGNARRLIPCISSLIFSIGYVAYDKPYLYEANSRPREIAISDQRSGWQIYSRCDAEGYTEPAGDCASVRNLRCFG